MANFEHIIHKNSNVVTGGNPKLPTTAQLAYGELAVNYAKDKETISLKNSNNEIVTFSSDSQLVKKADLIEVERVTAAALTDLEDRKLDKQDIEDYYTKEKIDNDHLVISSSLNELNTRVTANTTNISNLSESKQNTLVSGTNIKTINNQSILGSGNITIEGGSGGGGDINVIESVKVNGTALTPDADKAVNITEVPASIVTQDATHRFVSDTEKTTWNNKVSNVQADWNAASGLAQILNKPTIPAAVTESTVSGWGFTKNAGTVTSVKMNGTTNDPTNGVVDLGTVITSHQDISGKANTADLATVATSGSYNDLTNKPTIPSAPGTLNTTATTAQSTSASQSLSGNITLHKISKTGSYNDLNNKPTIPTVNDNTITLTFNGATVGTFTLNQNSNKTIDIGTIIGLPSFSAANNGQILGVVNGALAWITPTTIYTGSGTPSSSQGNDGDIYLQTS